MDSGRGGVLQKASPEMCLRVGRALIPVLLYLFHVFFVSTVFLIRIYFYTSFLSFLLFTIFFTILSYLVWVWGVWCGVWCKVCCVMFFLLETTFYIFLFLHIFLLASFLYHLFISLTNAGSMGSYLSLFSGCFRIHRGTIEHGCSVQRTWITSWL